MTVKQRSTHDLANAMHSRYLRADRHEKGRMLDEFVAATGYTRKRAIRLVRHGPPGPRAGHGGRPQRYSAILIGTLRVAGEPAAACAGSGSLHSSSSCSQPWKRKARCGWRRPTATTSPR